MNILMYSTRRLRETNKMLTTESEGPTKYACLSPAADFPHLHEQCYFLLKFFKLWLCRSHDEESRKRSG